MQKLEVCWSWVFVLLSKDDKHVVLLSRLLCPSGPWNTTVVMAIKKFNECIFPKEASAYRDSSTRLTFQNQASFRLSSFNYLKYWLIPSVLQRHTSFIHKGEHKIFLFFLFYIYLFYFLNH